MLLKTFIEQNKPFKSGFLCFYTPMLHFILSLLIKDLSDFKEPNKSQSRADQKTFTVF